MTYAEFVESLKGETPPPAASPLLRSLWFDGKGDWESSHNIAQDVLSNDGSWIHAYLHRKEGDLSNAQYWYSRAGKQMLSISLQEEWKMLVNAFLK